MFNAITTRSLLLSTALALFTAVSGCESKVDTANQPPPAYEGKYKNSRGQIVLEIRQNRAIFRNPTTGANSDINVSPNGNDLMVESSAGNFTLKFQPPDTMTGLPPAIAGDSTPLKKVQ